MHSLMIKSFIFILLINALGRTDALNKGGKKLQPSTAASIFAPNSAIFKIPVSKTVNLDFRKANEAKIQSELLKVLTDLLKNKDEKQEKIVLNIKPPTASNNSFVKSFTSLLRKETTFVVPEAVVGAQSTIFKKKSGQISTLRLTLYVVRQQKPKMVNAPRRDETRKDISDESPKPITEEANINMTQTENVTATVENVLRQLHDNSTGTGVNRTDIFLNLISSTNFNTSQINSLKDSIKQILQQLYPNSTTSTKTKLFHDKKAHVSKLEFEIDVKPREPTEREQEILEKLEKPVITNLNVTTTIYPRNATKPSIKSVSINGTKSVENTTSIIEKILLTNLKNVREKEMNKSIILVDLTLSKSYSAEQKDNMEKSLKDLIYKLYPESLISLKRKSENDKKLNISELNFEIIVKPKHTNLESSKPKLNVTVPSESLKTSLDTLKADLQNLVPYSQVLVQAQNMIFKDLDILANALRSQDKALHEEKIPIDLRKSGSSFTDELDKALPKILTALKETMKPISLSFKVTLPNNPEGRSLNSDICDIMKELTSRIPEKTRFGNVDIDVTLLPDTNQILPNENTEKIPPFLSEMKPMRMLNLTEPRINITEKINATLTEIMRRLPNFEKNSEHLFNMSMILPQNGTKLSIDDILDIIKRNVKALYPYSEILLQAETMIHRDLHILNLIMRLKPSEDFDRSRKNEEVLPIDLSELREEKPEEIEQFLTPLWSNLKKNKPMSFDLKLRPANDLDRRLLGNDICTIIDILSKSIPDDVLLNEISFRTTVTPEDFAKGEEDKMRDETANDYDYSEELRERDIPTTLLDLTNPGTNMTNEIHAVLENFIQEMKNDTRSIVSAANLSLSVMLPDNETLNVGDTLRTIKEDLLKLAPYSDIIIRTQNKIEDEIHMLELKIEVKHKEPTKKFRIDLKETGDFVPQEVDEVVHDIRTTKNPFSFALDMVIPEKADLESSSSEICSVNNIVINNIPKDSILTDTILKVSISPKTPGSFPENSELPTKKEEETKDETKNKENEIYPPRTESNNEFTQEMGKSFPSRSEQKKDVVLTPRSEEEMTTMKFLENINKEIKETEKQGPRNMKLPLRETGKKPSYSTEDESEPKPEFREALDSETADSAQRKAEPAKQLPTKDEVVEFVNRKHHRPDEEPISKIKAEDIPEIPKDRKLVDKYLDETTESIRKAMRDDEIVPGEKNEEIIRPEGNNEKKYQDDEKLGDERSRKNDLRHSEDVAQRKKKDLENAHDEVEDLDKKHDKDEKSSLPKNGERATETTTKKVEFVNRKLNRPDEEPSSKINAEDIPEIPKDRKLVDKYLDETTESIRKAMRYDEIVPGEKNEEIMRPGRNNEKKYQDDEKSEDERSRKNDLRHSEDVAQRKKKDLENAHDEVEDLDKKHDKDEKPSLPKNGERATETTTKKIFNDERNDVLSRMKKDVDEDSTVRNEVKEDSDSTTTNPDTKSRQKPSKPQIFTTDPIDLDNLNILDVESVLSKAISQYISELDKSKNDNKTVIINFLFKTSHISSTNLDNIESVLDDVFNSLNLKGEVMSDDVKLGLTKDNDIVIHMPCIVSVSNLRENLSRAEITTPKPLERISDLILGV